MREGRALSCSINETLLSLTGFIWSRVACFTYISHIFINEQHVWSWSSGIASAPKIIIIDFKHHFKNNKRTFSTSLFFSNARDCCITSHLINCLVTHQKHQRIYLVSISSCYLFPVYWFPSHFCLYHIVSDTQHEVLMVQMYLIV